MAWERGYYYRSRKINGRVEREYIGTGPMAELAALEDEIRRQAEERRRIELESLAVRLDQLDARVGRHDAAIELLVWSAMVVCGCRRHRRQWRRRKTMANEMVPAGSKAVAPPTRQQVTEAIGKAEKGDRKALRLLQRYLQHPTALSRFIGTAESTLRMTLGQRLAPDDKGGLVQAAVLCRQAEVQAEQLAGPGASALERLLCDRIATTGLHVTVMEIEVARALDPRISLVYEKAATLASRRHLTAVKALAQLRKLAPDVAVLVNVGGQEAGPRLHRAALGKVDDSTSNPETENDHDV
jgi:hypothetical protein